MQAVGSLETFAKLTAKYSDHLVFRTNDNPSPLTITSEENIPKSWEAVAFDGGVPDNEETLGYNKGTYLILYSPGANVAYFYRVRGSEGAQAGQSAFKQSLTIMQYQQNALDKLEAKLSESEAVQSLLAEKALRKEVKTKKLKKKLKKLKKETGQELLIIGINAIMGRLGISLESDDGGRVRVKPSSSHASDDNFDYEE